MNLKTQHISYAGLLIFIITAYYSVGHHHADEHFQLIEFAQFKLGKIEAIYLPWEFHEKMRPTLQPWIALIFIKAASLLQTENPFTITLMLRILSAVLYWYIITKLNKLLSDRYFKDVFTKKLFYFLSYFLWFVPYLAVRFSSENFTAIFLLFGLFYILKDDKNVKNLVYASIFLAISVLFRYQTGISVIAIVLWIILIAKTPLKQLVIPAIAFLLVIAGGTFLDYLFYGEFTLAPYNYLRLNLIEGKAAGFGTEPWYFYFIYFLAFAFPIISIPILFFLAIGLVKLKKNIFTWTIVPFILIHILLSHKEMRFLYPMLYPMIFISVYGLAEFYKERKVKTFQRVIFYIALAFNLILIVPMSFRPADEMVGNYRYIYDHLDDGNQSVITLEKNVFELLAGIKSTFYTPPNCNSEFVEAEKDLLPYLIENDIEKCFFVYPKFDFESSIEGYSVEKVYSVYPEWIKNISGVEWQSALHTHSVFIIRKE